MQKFAHFKTMTFGLKERVLTVTLNRPDKLNAVTEEMEYEFAEFFLMGAMNQDFDIVVLTGAGKAFSAGGDVENWMAKNVADPGRVNTDMIRRIVFAILDFPKPIIAKLNGHAIGLGATIALFCDVIFASTEAKIADPHVKLGLSAGDGGAVIWPQLIGYARAREYLMTGELIPATKAAEIGLINHAVPPAELDATVDAFVQKLSKGALLAIAATKQTVNVGLKQVATAVMDASAAYEKLTVYSRDHAEGVKAFAEKRKPVFTGR
jgi:enoyl-CoA hydratase